MKEWRIELPIQLPVSMLILFPEFNCRQLQLTEKRTMHFGFSRIKKKNADVPKVRKIKSAMSHFIFSMK